MYEQLKSRIAESMNQVMKHTTTVGGVVALQPLRKAVDVLTTTTLSLEEILGVCHTVRSNCWTVENLIKNIGPSLPPKAQNNARLALKWTEAIRQDNEVIGNEIFDILNPPKAQATEFVTTIGEVCLEALEAVQKELEVKKVKKGKTSKKKQLVEA